MFRKTALIALAAAVTTIGASMLTSNSADAAPGARGARAGGPGMGQARQSRNPGIGKQSGVRTRTPGIRNPGTRNPGRPGIARHPGHRHPGFARYPRHPIWLGYYPRYPRIWYAARPVVYGAAPLLTNHCTCLTKEYTAEGAVLFKDVCTNEAAVNPPLRTGLAPLQVPQQN